jgi:Flp pilus assembly protein TadD
MKLVFRFVMAAGLALGSDPGFDAQGRAEFAAGQLRAAKASFERAVRAASDRPVDQAVSLTNLAQTLLALGELSAAKDAVTRASIVLPDSARIWHLRGQVLMRQNDRGAEEAIRTALRLSAEEPAVAASCRSDLATLVRSSGRERDAMTLLEQAVAGARPGQARARMLDNLGMLQWKSGRRTLAIGTIRQALEEMEAAVSSRHPDVARILEDYARVLASLGRKAESRAAAVRARELTAAFAWQANSESAAVDWRDLR